MTRPHITVDNPRLHLLTILLITFVFYAGTFNNFFYADDFLWLYRVKHLAGNWSSIFIVENRYFTPLTYLSFYVNHKLFGLNPFWYHLHDFIFHALNGCLLYLLTYRISGNRLTAFIAATIFVTSSAILITVLWSSARTDLIMVFFSLATMVAFGNGDSTKHKLLPLALYALALCAKGTALVVPVILFLLTANTKPLKERVIRVAPYFAINVMYVTLLMLSNSLAAKLIEPADKVVSFANYAKSLPALIVPERYLAEVGTPVLLFFCVIILIIMLAITVICYEVTARIGTTLTVFGLLPLLFTRDYVLAGNKASAIQLLSSPSNRVYLAYAGISLLYAVLLGQFLLRNRRLSVRILSGSLLLMLLGSNYLGIKFVNQRWHKGTESVRTDLAILEKNRAMLTEDSVLLLFNFEGSSGFSKAMLKTYYDLQHFQVYTCDNRITEELTNVDLSPLSNSQYKYNVKLILDCPGNPYVDTLSQNGNNLLQNISADYRQLYTASDMSIIQPTRKRLDYNMAELRALLTYCSPKVQNRRQ